jgi:hypothetical protein
MINNISNYFAYYKQYTQKELYVELINELSYESLNISKEEIEMKRKILIGALAMLLSGIIVSCNNGSDENGNRDKIDTRVIAEQFRGVYVPVNLNHETYGKWEIELLEKTIHINAANDDEPFETLFFRGDNINDIVYLYTIENNLFADNYEREDNHRIGTFSNDDDGEYIQFIRQPLSGGWRKK